MRGEFTYKQNVGEPTPANGSSGAWGSIEGDHHIVIAALIGDLWVAPNDSMEQVDSSDPEAMAEVAGSQFLIREGTSQRLLFLDGEGLYVCSGLTTGTSVYSLWVTPR
jgi:hypothetical protein